MGYVVRGLVKYFMAVQKFLLLNRTLQEVASSFYYFIVFLFYILKYNPLFEAARNGHTDIVRLLIENGADVNKGGWVR